MKMRLAALAAVSVTALMFPNITAFAATDEMGFIRISPGEEQYKNPFGVGVEVATMYGDPSKPGIYVIRIKWPPGIMSKPHKHAEDRHVVVISGSWYTGTGDDFEPAKAVPLRARRLHDAPRRKGALGRHPRRGRGDPDHGVRAKHDGDEQTR